MVCVCGVWQLCGRSWVGGGFGGGREVRSLRMAAACVTPRVAVCVSGQLRFGARQNVAVQMQKAWSRIGENCADVYVNIGIEPVYAAGNHAALTATSHENATTFVNILRPLEWRVKTYPLGHKSQTGRDCDMRSADTAASHRPRKLCHKGPSSEGTSTTHCSAANCTHCATTQLIPQFQRISECAAMVQAAVASRAGVAPSYEWFVYHRPDIWLFGLPAVSEWGRAFRDEPYADTRLSHTALFCGAWEQANEYMASDVMIVLNYQNIDIVVQLAAAYSTCHSREEHLALGCKADKHWAQWHTSECIMHAHFARRGFATKGLGSDKPRTPWHWFRISHACQIMRGGDGKLDRYVSGYK